MELIVDLHIHSHYSRATSPKMNIASLYSWGKIKGINVIGTGDFTHPAWIAELQEKLEPAETGLFKLKKEYADEEDKNLPESVKNNLIRFILTVEISNIYSKGGKVRKLHNLVIVPDFETAEKVNAELDKIGNLKADGRPILGMDSKDLLKITLESHLDSLFVPAHIWTPWFAMFGSKSGFDSIEEAFGNLAPEIVAIETGLSSDPFMNWRLNELQSRTLISNSDAHSPQKLGREANVIDCELSYKSIIGAVKTNDKRMVGTIEFFPEEGKYHHDGHAKCGVVMMPVETKKHKGICPKCKKPLVVGVQYRVDEIANNPAKYKPKNYKKVEYIIPLVEIISEIKGVKGTNSKTVVNFYDEVISKLGHEFGILRSVDIQSIEKAGFERLGKAVKLMREGKVYVKAGYDGIFGVIKVFPPGKDRVFEKQMGLGL